MNSDNLLFEKEALNRGHRYIAGVDEAGRGPLAGPVVAAAVILPELKKYQRIRDSKKIPPLERERLFSLIVNEAIAIGVGVVSKEFIEKENILIASLEAMRRAIYSLEITPDLILVDGIHPVPISIEQRCIKKGDQKSQSISAASIIAKVYRDRIMDAYDAEFPQYGFSKNKGYPTRMHIEALRIYGACPIHRKTFKGVGF
ncbi:MAG TPA: ribonuclease HII [Desulfobacteraceae bacterium]|nr:ribonuclease HII [Desulfobacteraceae bacterium]